MLTETSMGWILSGDMHIPGSRIHGINIHRQMINCGIRSEIIRMPAGYSEKLSEHESMDLYAQIKQTGINTIIFQKVNGSHAQNLCEWLGKIGKRTIFICCDTVDNQMAERADLVLAVSTYLKKLFKKKYYHKIRVLHDPVEIPERFRFNAVSMPQGKRLKGVYLASQYPDFATRAMLRLCQEYVDVTVISAPPPQTDGDRKISGNSSTIVSLIKEHRLSIFRRFYNKLLYSYQSKRALSGFNLGSDPVFEFIKWDLTTVYEIVSRHHVGLIPIHMDSTFKKSKSANRMSTLMALGLPVIASPLPAYLEHATHGKNILFAQNGTDWRKQLKKIDVDREKARELASNARDFAWRWFSPESVLALFLDHVKGL